MLLKVIVASLTDAWIETSHPGQVLGSGIVASLTDAWIETLIAA